MENARYSSFAKIVIIFKYKKLRNEKKVQYDLLHNGHTAW